MNIIDDKILDLKIINNNFFIICKKKQIIAPIKNGSVNININNEYNNNIGISSLKKNQYIKIYYKNNFKVVNKIVILTIYKFDEYSSESSDSDFFDNI